MSAFLNQVYCKSSVNMAELPEASVDLVFTSPPYEKMRHYSDSPEDLGNYQGAEFVGRLKPILAECRRVLKPTGSLFLNFQAPHLEGVISPSEYLIPKMAAEELGFLYIQPHYWIKPNANPLTAKEVLKNSVELIWHFAKSQDFYVNKDALREPSVWAGKDKRTERYNPLGKDPGNAFYEPKSQDQQNEHPAKMPQRVAERFILYGSPVGGIVLDPFCGSGTTLVMAQKHGRGFVGYELHPEYAKTALERFSTLNGASAAPQSLQSKKWLTMDDLCDYLSLTKATIYTKVCRGELPVNKMGRLNRFDREAIDQWMAGQGTQNTAS